MASHHHLQGCCNPSTATTSAVCCCCPSYSYTTPCHNPPPPDPHLHHYHPHSTQPHLHSTFSNPPYAAQSFHQQATRYYHPLKADVQREDYLRELQHHQQCGLNHVQPIVSSLLHRITALESSFRNHSSSRAQSLRDAAARTIQTHFRAFLVRRSRTLRQLKDLASIKSAINILKSSVSDNNHIDPLALSHKALHLLLKLDSIKGDDPMIRDGKKSISRELTRFLDLIDGLTLKRYELSTGFTRKNGRQGENNRKSRDLYNNQKMSNANSSDLGRDKRLEDLVNRIEVLYNKVSREEDGEEDEEIEIPRISLAGKNGVPQPRNGGFRKGPDYIQAKTKKSVKFSEDGNVYYVPRSRNGLVLVEDCDSDDGNDLLNAKKKLDVLQREAERVGGISVKDTEDDEVAQSDDEVAQLDDGDDQVSTKSSNDGERVPTYSAPLPVKMETRSDLMDKRKTVKLVE